MPYRIEEKEALRIVGIRIPVTEVWMKIKNLSRLSGTGHYKAANSRKFVSCQTNFQMVCWELPHTKIPAKFIITFVDKKIIKIFAF